MCLVKRHIQIVTPKVSNSSNSDNLFEIERVIFQTDANYRDFICW